MLNVYKADISHIDIWLPLAKEFYDEGFDEYKWGFNEEHARATYKLFILNHVCFLAELNGEPVGCLAGVISQHHFNYHFLFYQESMWFVKKQHRGSKIAKALLEATQEECRTRGCEKIIVGYTQKVIPETMKRFYTQLGFQLFETHYIKDL